MTTIVADFNNKIMVSDTRCSYGGTVFRMIKIHKAPDGTLIGFSGNVTEATKFVEWFMSGHNKAKVPRFGDDAFDALTMNDEGIMLWDSSLVATKVNQSFFAVGSGAQYAIGAMKAGASAEKAVTIATEEDSCSGLPLDTREYIKLKTKKPRNQKVKPLVVKDSKRVA